MNTNKYKILTSFYGKEVKIDPEEQVGFGGVKKDWYPPTYCRWWLNRFYTKSGKLRKKIKKTYYVWESTCNKCQPFFRKNTTDCGGRVMNPTRT